MTTVWGGLDRTHDPDARSWVHSAQGSDFPLQNLPLCVFRLAPGEPFRGGVGIGDRIVDLAALAAAGALEGSAAAALSKATGPTLNPLLESEPATWNALRHGLFDLLHEDGSRHPDASWLVARDAAMYALPARIGGYTDFYTSFAHALAGARMADPDNDVAPAFRWMPIGYDGRASAIQVSGNRVVRPVVQLRPPDSPAPEYRAAAWLDYELEVCAWIGGSSCHGERIPLHSAEQRMFGLGLLNDWSIRDLQLWEMVPLGPFLSKSVATTVSPWIVTLAALAPFRSPNARPPTDPPVLRYLDAASDRAQGGVDIRLEAWLESDTPGAPPTRLSQTTFAHQYWTFAQMLTHHASAGCRIDAGDLIASGTVSGPAPSEAGSIMELTWAGRRPIELADGTRRGFLDDGDTVVLRGWCEAPGRSRIGFGECRGTIAPAIPDEETR